MLSRLALLASPAALLAVSACGILSPEPAEPDLLVSHVEMIPDAITFTLDGGSPPFLAQVESVLGVHATVEDLGRGEHSLACEAWCADDDAYRPGDYRILVNGNVEAEVSLEAVEEEEVPEDTASVVVVWTARFHDLDLELHLHEDGSGGIWTWIAGPEQSWTGGLAGSFHGDTIKLETTDQPPLEPEFLAWNRLPTCCRQPQLQIVLPVFDCEMEGVLAEPSALQVTVVSCTDLADYDPIRPALDSISRANPLPSDLRNSGVVTGTLTQRVAFELHCLLPPGVPTVRSCALAEGDIAPIAFIKTEGAGR